MPGKTEIGRRVHKVLTFFSFNSLSTGNIRLESSFKDLQKHLEQYGGVESVYLKPQWNFAFVDLLPSTDIDDFISKANGSTYHKNVLTVARKKSPGSHIGTVTLSICWV